MISTEHPWHPREQGLLLDRPKKIRKYSRIRESEKEKLTPQDEVENNAPQGVQTTV
jgi:hypothetical protein